MARYLRRSDCNNIQQCNLLKRIESSLGISDDEQNPCNESKGNDAFSSDVPDEEIKDSQVAEEDKEIYSVMKTSTKEQSENVRR